jgi:hypothetical protein
MRSLEVNLASAFRLVFVYWGTTPLRGLYFLFRSLLPGASNLRSGREYLPTLHGEVFGMEKNLLRSERAHEAEPGRSVMMMSELGCMDRS